MSYFIIINCTICSAYNVEPSTSYIMLSSFRNSLANNFYIISNTYSSKNKKSRNSCQDSTAYEYTCNFL